MDFPIDSQKTLEVIERMKLAKIGEYKKWETIIKKIKKDVPLNQGELEYYTNLTRIYKDSTVTSRSKISILNYQNMMKSHLAKNAVKIHHFTAT